MFRVRHLRCLPSISNYIGNYQRGIRWSSKSHQLIIAKSPDIRVLFKQLKGDYMEQSSDCVLVMQLSGSNQPIIRRISGSHQAVISQSSGSHQVVIRQSSGSHQAVIRLSSSSHLAVTKQLLESHQTVIK